MTNVTAHGAAFRTEPNPSVGKERGMFTFKENVTSTLPKSQILIFYDLTHTQTAHGWKLLMFMV